MPLAQRVDGAGQSSPRALSRSMMRGSWHAPFVSRPLVRSGPGCKAAAGHFGFRVEGLAGQHGGCGMSFLGIDLGTSGLRALLVDDAGQPIGSTERHYDVAHPHPGWSEQDPADWITALQGAVADLRAAHPQFASLRGIGVAGHMHGACVLDAQGPRAAPRHPVERYAQSCRGRRAGRRSAVSHADRQHRLPRLHRAKAGLDGRA